MELESLFLVHQSIRSSYIQQHSLATLMSNPPLFPYAAKSPSHCQAHSVNSSYTQHNYPATLTPIPSLLPIRSIIIQPLSRPFRHFFLYAAQSSSHSHALSVKSS